MSLVDLPSLAGGTTPMLAAGQASLASLALSKMLLYLNRTAYDIGAAGDLERQLVSRNFAGFVGWATDYVQRAPQNAEMAQLRQAVQDAQASI